MGAVLFNLAVFEISGDKIRVSQRFIGFQISGYTASSHVALKASIDIASVFERFLNMVGFTKKYASLAADQLAD